MGLDSKSRVPKSPSVILVTQHFRDCPGSEMSKLRCQSVVQFTSLTALLTPSSRFHYNSILWRWSPADWLQSAVARKSSPFCFTPPRPHWPHWPHSSDPTRTPQSWRLVVGGHRCLLQMQSNRQQAHIEPKRRTASQLVQIGFLLLSWLLNFECSRPHFQNCHPESVMLLNSCYYG